ncbi:MAG: potassium channel protein [Thermodesulfobacteriota bacterium]|nr:potassium channel protein [Thermodesulfobacteriota bacterium]
MTPSKQLKYSLTALFIILFGGTLGYSFIEGWSLLESLYMTVITLTTVGYGEVHEISPFGRLFTIVLIITGVGIVAYIIGTFTRIMIEGEIRKIFGRRKMERRIRTLKNHYIICGFGRIGKVICKELTAQNLPFIVIEKDPEVIQKVDAEKFLYLYDDATSEDVLLQAGITKATGLIACVSSDADNLYSTMTARELNPKLLIIARACNEGAQKKLLRAGADKVVFPHYIGGMKIAQAILRPHVLDFVEIATQNHCMELQLEEIRVIEGSSLAETTFQRYHINEDFGLIIVAVKKPSGEMIFNPSVDARIEVGDILIVMGKYEDLKRFEELQ